MVFGGYIINMMMYFEVFFVVEFGIGIVNFVFVIDVDVGVDLVDFL